jgi:hypothetical protein
MGWAVKPSDSKLAQRNKRGHEQWAREPAKTICYSRPFKSFAIALKQTPRRATCCVWLPSWFNQRGCLSNGAPWATHAPWHRRQRYTFRVRHLHSFLCEETYSCYLLMLWRTPECRASNNSHGFCLKGCRTTMPAFFFESTGQTATPRAGKPRHLAHSQFSSCSSRLATETKTMETFSFARR